MPPPEPPVPPRVAPLAGDIGEDNRQEDALALRDLDQLAARVEVERELHPVGTGAARRELGLAAAEGVRGDRRAGGAADPQLVAAGRELLDLDREAGPVAADLVLGLAGRVGVEAGVDQAGDRGGRGHRGARRGGRDQENAQPEGERGGNAEGTAHGGSPLVHESVQSAC